jgi:hypothetical protein
LFDDGQGAFRQDGKTELIPHLDAHKLLVVFRAFKSPPVKLLIKETLVHEGRMELRNFGVFQVRKRQPRTARNLQTGSEVRIPGRLVVRFKSGQEMKRRVGWLTQAPNGRE